MDNRLIQFSDLQSLSLFERDQLPSSYMKELIVKNKLASFPLEECANLGADNLMTVAERVGAVSAEWPSCGIALCMHYHVLMAIHRMPIFKLSKEILNSVKNEESLLASAFSEFIPGRGIFSPALHYERIDNDNLVLNGSKKPCTLASLAKFLVVSCSNDNAKEPIRLALIPRSDDIQVDTGVYTSTIFGASDTQGLRFEGAKFPSNTLDQIEGGQTSAEVLNYGMCLFNILISACYSGIATTLYEKINAPVQRDAEIQYQYLRLATLSQVMLKNMVRAAVEGVTEESVAEVLVMRYQIENSILNFTKVLWTRLGAQSVVGDKDVIHLINTCQMIKYHPLSEKRFIESL